MANIGSDHIPYLLLYYAIFYATYHMSTGDGLVFLRDVIDTAMLPDGMRRMYPDFAHFLDKHMMEHGFAYREG